MIRKQVGSWVLALVVVAGSAWAEEYYIHGNAGRPQSADQWSAVVNMAGGLQGYLRSSQGAQIHIPLGVTTDSSKALNRVKITFRAGPDLHVTSVRLYDGDTKIKEKSGSWTGNTAVSMRVPPGYQIKTGLGLSLTVTSGTDLEDSHYFVLMGASVSFVPAVAAAE